MGLERVRKAIRPHLLKLGVCLALALYALMLWRLPPPEMWLTIDSQSEALSFEVVDPLFSVMRLPGATFVDADGTTVRCATVVVEPGAKAKVEYRRTANNTTVLIDPVPGDPESRTRVEMENGDAIELEEALVLTLGDCPNSTLPSLPVWGRIQVGDFARSAGRDGAALPGSLIDGSVSAYARSHDKIFGISLPRSVYKVGTFDLPAGSVVHSPPVNQGQAPQLWTGRADIDGGKLGLRMRATSESRVLVFAPPNGAPEQTRPYDLDFSDYAQYLKDPNVVKFQFLLAAFLFLANGSRNLLRWLLGEKSSEGPPTKPRRYRFSPATARTHRRKRLRQVGSQKRP